MASITTPTLISLPSARSGPLLPAAKRAVAARASSGLSAFTEGTCDRCGGEGKLPCPGCASSSKAGVVERRPFGWLGSAFGLPVESSEPCRCTKGLVICWRCKGKKKLRYRSSDWR
jgi:hypothetical protein